MTDPCDLCGPVGREDCCEASVRYGSATLKCTREPDHHGPHAACGALEDEHPMVEWDDVEEVVG